MTHPESGRNDETGPHTSHHPTQSRPLTSFSGPVAMVRMSHGNSPAVGGVKENVRDSSPNMTPLAQGAHGGNGTQHLTKPPEREMKQIRETDQMLRSAGGRESKRMIETARSSAC